MAVVLDQSTIFNFVYFGRYTSQSTGSFGSNDLTGVLVNSGQLPTTKDAELDSTVNISFGYHTYYKMQGFNPTLQVYEDWHSMDEPLLDPPSGNPLLNIGIIGSWIDR